MPRLEEAISKAIDRYNHYRSPEVIAKLIDVNEGQFVVDFSGPFCKSCAVYDYLDDLIYELKGLSDIQPLGRGMIRVSEIAIDELWRLEVWKV